MNEKMNIYEKLLYIQQHLKAPKGQYNEYGNFKYRSCEDIQEAVKPLLKDVRAVLLITDKVELIGERYYIVANVILQDTESDEHIINTAYARETDIKPKMDAAQITGSSSSYARKYALNGLFCIDDTKDPDSMDNSKNNVEKPGNTPKQHSNPQATIGDNHVASIRLEIARTGAKEAAVCYQYRVKNLKEMNMTQYKNCMDIFKDMPNKGTPCSNTYNTPSNEQTEQMTLQLH